MSVEEEALPILAGITAKAIVDNAKRLGLTWTMRLATVVSVNAGFTEITAMYDADTEPINMVNLTNTLLMPGDRVYAMFVPPAGNFIIGTPMLPQQTYLWSKRVTLSVSATSIAITEIPSNLTTLNLDWTLRDTGAVVADVTAFRINGDASASYGHRFVQAAGATASALTHTQSFGVATFAVVGAHPGSSATAGRFGVGRVVIPAWNGPHANYLMWTFHSGYEAAANSGFMLTGDGAYGGAGPPYTSVTFVPNTAFVAESQVTAWGLTVA